MQNKSKNISFTNYDEEIEDYIENITISKYVSISKLNFPISLKYLEIDILKEVLLNLPVSLEKIKIKKGCKCCLDKSKIPFECEVELLEEQSHDYEELRYGEGEHFRSYATNYNILRIMAGMGGLNYSN